MRRAAGIAAGVLVAGAALLLTPVADPELSSRPDPCDSYAAAVARIAAVKASEAGLALQAEGRSIARLTGRKTARAVVIFHGLTSVPEQFRLIADAYAAQGYNVWLPRLPRHGLTDRMTDQLSHLTSQELRDFVDGAVDIGTGLGDSLTVVGLSGGGALTLWAAAERPEVDKAFVISPLLLPAGYPDWQMRILVRALRLSPADLFQWHDDRVKDSDQQAWGYPRQSYKAVAALLRMAYWVEAKAVGTPFPVVPEVVLVRNDGDTDLDVSFGQGFVERVVAPDRLTVVTIPASEGLGHDFVGFQESSDNYPRLGVAYRHLSEALGMPISLPGAGDQRSDGAGARIATA